MTDTQKEHFFDLPGLQFEANRFRKLLDVSSEFDHILIRGPRGTGKSYFAQVFKAHTRKDPIVVNCAALHPDTVVSDLFGHKKGSFTGAEASRDGYIKTAFKEKRPLFLEEMNSLDPAHQAKLLVFMQTGNYFALGSDRMEHANVRILAAMNEEGDIKLRRDLLDRFRIIVDVLPLHDRREDILAFIAEKYPDLLMDKIELLSLYAYFWPGNIRELDRVLFELKAGVGLRNDIREEGSYGQCSIMNYLKSNSFKNFTEKQIIEMSKVIYDGIVPWSYDEISQDNTKEKIRIVNSDGGYKIILIKDTHTHDCIYINIEVFCDYFEHVKIGNFCDSSLFDLTKESENDSYLYFFKTWLSEPNLTDEELFTRMLGAALLSPLNVNKFNQVVENDKDKAMKYIMSLGSYKNVERFLHSEGLRIKGSQKSLACHWEISTSTLNDRMKKIISGSNPE